MAKSSILLGHFKIAAEDDKAADNEVEECALVCGELKSVLGYQETGSAFDYQDTGYPELWSALVNRGSLVSSMPWDLYNIP